LTTNFHGRRRIDYRFAVPPNPKEMIMLNYALIFLIVALVAGILGFAGIAGAAAGIAKLLFVVFLVLFLVSVIFRRRVV